MKRKIISSHDLGVNDYSKSSSGFVSDITQNTNVQPAFIKISDSDAWKFYRGNEWVNSTVNGIVDDCVKYRTLIVPKDKTMELKPRHERAIGFVQDFLGNINDNRESFRSVREKFIKDMLVVGRGVDELVKEKSLGVLQEVYALKADTIKVKSNKHGTIPEKRAYIQKGKNLEETEFDKDEIIWGVYREVSGTLYGEKPLDTLANAVASDILRATYNSNFFINGAKAGGIVSLDGMSTSELKKFRQYWKDNHKGVDKAHRMVAVNVPVKYVSDTITNQDMEFTEYGRELRMKIFAVYHMQPFVMGIVEQSMGKINPEQQWQIYKDRALKPILAKEAEYYTKHILHDGFGLYDFEIIFEGIDLADAVTQSEIDRMDINSGILTINEVRKRRGLNPVPWGNTPISVLPGGNQIDPETGRLIPPNQQENSDDEGEDDGNDEEKRFVNDVKGNLKHFLRLFDEEKGLKMLKASVTSKDYTRDIKTQAVFEGSLKNACERYSEEDNLNINAFGNYLYKQIIQKSR